MAVRFLLAVLVAAALPATSVLAGDRPGVPASLHPDTSTARGVVWSPPERSRPALRELSTMHARGITAVRLTRPVRDAAVLARADTLGLRLFVDLPMRPLSASAVQDSAEALQEELDAVLRLARAHPSLRHVGLVPLSDTSEPSACSVLASLTSRTHARGPSGMQTYLVTPFRPDTEQCTDAADRVLLDLRDAPDPVARWTTWAEAVADPGRLGVGALGTWTYDAAATGLRVPHSPERQARWLENALRAFVPASPPVAPVADDTTRGASAPVVFVHRWHDVAPSTARSYGLYAADGTPRPALDVVTGIYTGRQRVFAFPTGTPPPPPTPWATLAAWAILIGLSILYVRLPLFRRTAARYFTGHGFYLDAVREGRETTLDLNGLLLTATSVGVGIVATLAVQSLAAAPSLAAIGDVLPTDLRARFFDTVDTPAVAGVAAGIAVGVGVLLWAALLLLGARRWKPLRFEQMLTLVTWPCWTLFVLLPVVLVLPAEPQTTLVAAGGLTVLATIAVGRALWDVSAVTRVPALLLVGGVLLSPPVVTALATTVFAAQSTLSLSFLWHLLSRT